MHLYPRTIEEKLGFDVIRRRVSEKIQSQMGQDAWAAEEPASDGDTIRSRLEQAGEVADAIRFDDPIPLDHTLDVREVVRRTLPQDAFVPGDDLLAVRLTMSTCRRLHAYFRHRKQKYPVTAGRMEAVTPLEEVERFIEHIVDEDGNIRDDASTELRRLRRLHVQKQHRLREVLNAELRKAVGEGFATEDQPTIRAGRMVIPVRAEAKRKVQGFVHDTSATGQTVFIEPSACLELNNEVREIEISERREIERILKDAASLIRRNRAAITANLKALGAFDLVYAKGRFAVETRSVVPSVVDEPVIDLRAGRNPVLLLRFQRESEEGRTVVPLTLQVGYTYRTLVITGPNAGGKSVAMKTVGLLVLMTAYGMPIPADEKTTLGVFKQLLVDVGDEQSIEEDLSTFSSHLANMRYMLEHGDAHTLVLIDEAGTGTDPAEGGALAQAVLEQLNEDTACTIATTHHGTLKAFAHNTDGVENGSMEFDQSTLSPTYRFQAGIPGSSYAFEIADRLGLSGRLLHRARQLAGEESRALEDLIAQFEERNRALREQMQAAERTKAEAERARDEFTRRLEKLRAERDEIRQNSLDEAERIVSEANARIERTIREIKEAQAAREQTRAVREELEQFRSKLVERKRRSGARPKPKQEQRPMAASEDGGEIREGDQVVLDDGSAVADVIKVKGDDIEIAVGSVRSRVKLQRLRKVGGKRAQQVSVKHASLDAASSSVLRARTSIDLRGKRVEEALQETTRFLDDAIAAGAERVEILHGKGTGALRTAITELLSRNPDVKHFEEAAWNQGGAGVTVVMLT